MTKEPAKGLVNICSTQLDKWISIILSISVVINQIMCYSNLAVILPSETGPLVHIGHPIRLTQVYLHTLEISCSTSGNTHIKFLDKMGQLVQYFITNHKNLVLLGDFNIHVQHLANQDSLV